MRKRMVTRTIKKTVAVVNGIQTNPDGTVAIENRTVEFPTFVTDEKAILKSARATLEFVEDGVKEDGTKVLKPTGYKVAGIVECDTLESLYGMDETEFVKFAKVLPPRTKVNDDGTVDTEAEANAEAPAEAQNKKHRK